MGPSRYGHAFVIMMIQKKRRKLIKKEHSILGMHL